jgi:hypothetical protein
MKIKIINLSIFFIILSILVHFFFISYSVDAKANIDPDGSNSPIQKYFSIKKILWTFDDYFIHLDHHPPHKGFGGLTNRITDFGGHVNIMVVLTTPEFTDRYNNEIRNYSFVKEFGWSQEKINKSLEFFNQTNVYAQCHGWNQSDYGNIVSLDQAYELVNYTLWNWKNNYNIQPNFYIGHASSGNYNITLALKEFSEKYWAVYGEYFRWDNLDLFPNLSRNMPAVEYIGRPGYVAMFDPLFGCDWGDPCVTFAEAQELFNNETLDKEIIFIRGNPDFLNNEDNSTQGYLGLWESWIDWIYGTHNIVNINHTQAIQYITDRGSFIVEKNGPNNFTIDLTNCKFNHKILFTQPYTSRSFNWTLTDEQGKNISKIFNDIHLDLESGKSYFFITYDEIYISEETSLSDQNENQSSGFEVFVSLIAIALIVFFKRK